MFEPGHLHRANTIASGDMPLFSVDLFYEVRQDPNEGPMLHMRLQGQVNGQAFEEVFELHRDTAFNFASVASRRTWPRPWPGSPNRVRAASTRK